MEHIDVSEQSRLFRVGAEKYGGSFVKKLADALRSADPSNTQRIKEAFPEYWTKYVRVGKQMEDKDVHL